MRISVQRADGKWERFLSILGFGTAGNSHSVGENLHHQQTEVYLKM
jgi:hypothetical protein